MLRNRKRMCNIIFSGVAWQLIYCIEDEKQLIPKLKKVQKNNENLLTSANFTVDKINK